VLKPHTARAQTFGERGRRASAPVRQRRGSASESKCRQEHNSNGSLLIDDQNRSPAGTI